MPDSTHDDTLTLPDIAAIRSAATRIAPLVHRTPVLSCRSLDAEAGAELHFKCENFQKIGAFKARGASNAVFALADAAAGDGVVTHSSGNHGAAVAYAARARGIPAWIVMPENAPRVKQENVRRFGATIRFCAPTVAAREEACAEVRRQTGATLVHPFDNVDVIAGQGTAALELLDDGAGSRHRHRAGGRRRIAVRHGHRRALAATVDARLRRGARERRRRGEKLPLGPRRAAASDGDDCRRTAHDALRRARSPRFAPTLRRSARRAKRRSCGRCG